MWKSFLRWMPVGRFWLQFSLAKLFGLVTVCAVGTWYWYQLPYPVERKVISLDPVCLQVSPAERDAYLARPANYREVQYYRRVRGGSPIRHGPYRGYDSQGNLLRSGAYRNGQQHGEFIRYAAGGAKISQATILNGKLEGPRRSWDLTGNLTDESNFLHSEQHGVQRSWDANGKLLKEENFERGVLHGSFKERWEGGGRLLEGSFTQGLPSGKWTWHPRKDDASRIVGQWREGRADGRWEWLDSDGQRYLVADFDRGLARRLEPDDLSPRILEELVRPNHDPAYFWMAFERMNVLNSETTVRDVVRDVGRHIANWPPCDLLGTKLAQFDDSAPIPADLSELPAVLLLAKLLRRESLGFDLRYGRLSIETMESIRRWNDSTGISRLMAPPDSPLAKVLDQETNIDFVEQPLKDALMYLGDLHRIQIRLSPDPNPRTAATADPELPVTKTLRAITLRNALGAILNDIHYRASLDGETLVIEPQ